MNVFVIENGEKTGPLPVFEVHSRVQSGVLKRDDLGWHEGCEKWAPLKDLPALSDLLAPNQKPEISDTPETSRQSQEEPLPWIRFFARMVDLSLLLVLNFGLLLIADKGGFFSVEDLATEKGHLAAFFTLGTMVLWSVLEGWLMSTFGMTPGKYLFRILVVKKHGDVPGLRFGEAFLRAMFVWSFGVFLLVPYASPFFLLLSFRRLRMRKITLWDEKMNLAVHHGEVGTKNYVIGSLLALPLLILFLFTVLLFILITFQR